MPPLDGPICVGERGDGPLLRGDHDGAAALFCLVVVCGVCVCGVCVGVLVWLVGWLVGWLLCGCVWPGGGLLIAYDD
jgi:hypothetical protein